MTKMKQCVDGGDCWNNLRIVKMESALRIINTLASFAGNESDTTAWRIIAAIKKEATEALQ